MASIAELIDFLMSLMRDDNTRQQFERNPDAVLNDKGLENVTGQDVRDARLMMADSGACQARPGRHQEQGGRADHDAIREIQHTTNSFVVGDVTTTVITVNDNDTVVVDSFNTDVTAIQDNDTTDVDVISIVDGDDDKDDDEDAGTDSGAEEGAAPEGEAELENGSEEGLDAGGEPADETGLEVGAGEGAAPADGSDLDLPEDFPEQDSGFDTLPELGVEAGPELPADEPLDELAG